MNIEAIETEAHRLAKDGDRLEAIKTIRQALGSLSLAVQWANRHYPVASPIDNSIRLASVRRLREAATDLRGIGFGELADEAEALAKRAETA